jgi:lipase chaperone LimK
MSVRSPKEIPGIEFVVDARGRRKFVIIDLERHHALWEDLFDAYDAQQRRNEPRESLSKVKKRVQSAPRRV